MKLGKDIVFLSGKRTAFGTFGGTLKDWTATDLAVVAAKAALAQANVRPEEIDHSIFGNALQTSADAIYLARHVALKSGCPHTVPALTLNRLCGSGFQSLITAAEQLLLGEADVVLAGGTESMSTAPHTIRGARWGLPLGKPNMGDLLWDALVDPYVDMPMAMTAEKVGEKYGITREQCDVYAARSQQTWKAAQDGGRFEAEIAPVEIKDKKGNVTAFKVDEHPRPTSTPESLAKLPPYFKKDGLVSAGNASGICDGAGAMVLTTAEIAQKRGAKPLGRLLGWGIVGCDPSIMGIGPAPAIRRALERTGLRLDQIDLIEVNEAFAPQYLAVEKDLGLDRERVNVNGGAIALGHPLAASGTRITTTLLYELKRRGKRYGIGSACIGGGQGIAVIVESL